MGTLTGERTTPEAPDLQATLAAMARQRRRRGRDGGLVARARAAPRRRHTVSRAVFTNLSHDHLDYHATMEAYFEAKARAVRSPSPRHRAVVNLDIPYGRLLADSATIPTTGYSLDDRRRHRGRTTGSQFTWRRRRSSSARRAFNVANALAAAEAALAAGLDEATSQPGLSRPVAVPGRFELIESPASPSP